MHGLELTYRILAESRNEAATDALARALPTAYPGTRRMILAALAHRQEPRAADLLLENWHHLNRVDQDVLAGKPRWMEDAVARAIESRSHLENAFQAISALHLTGSFSEIVSIAESDSDSALRVEATKTVLRLADKQGAEARQERAHASVRGPMLARLVESVQQFPVHQNNHLVDAYLLASAWGDVRFRAWIQEASPIQKRLLARFSESKQVGLVDLLVGYLNRRQIPGEIAKAIVARDDDAMRFAILGAIGHKPSGTTLQNLQTMGVPPCLGNPRRLFTIIDEKHRAALVHAYAAGSKDGVEVLQVVTEAVIRGGTHVVPAASLALSRCEIPDTDYFMRAAIPVAKAYENGATQEGLDLPPDGRLVKRLMDLLSHEDVGLARGARRVLGPLHAENMLPRFEGLRPRSRRRLGRIVMLIDDQALDRVRDALRHPVLERRLEAIATADALAAVEMLTDSFTRIVRDDHQAARVRAAEAMASARDKVTMGLLEEMVALPESQVHDAATEAIRIRRSAGAR